MRGGGEVEGAEPLLRLLCPFPSTQTRHTLVTATISIRRRQHTKKQQQANTALSFNNCHCSLAPYSNAPTAPQPPSLVPMTPVPPLHPRRPITSTRQWRPLPGGLDFLGSGRLCGIEFVIQEPPPPPPPPQTVKKISQGQTQMK